MQKLYWLSMDLPKAKELQEAKEEYISEFFTNLKFKKSEYINEFIYVGCVKNVFVFSESQSLIHENATMGGKPCSHQEETLVRIFKIRLHCFTQKNSNLRTDEEIERH